MSRRPNIRSDLQRLRARLKVRPLRETVQLEVIHAMEVAEGDKELAAALLGIGKNTIYRKLERVPRRHW